MYRVVFMNRGQVYEVYVRQVSQPDLYGFVTLEGFEFRGHAGIVVNPAEQRLEAEFAGVKRSFVPMHAIIRIDEVERHGEARISDAGDAKVMPFPLWTGPRKPPGADGSRE